MMSFYECKFRDQVQKLAVADLEAPSTAELIQRILPDRVDVVYSDPPWNPGNATYWRTHASKARCENYLHFLESWCHVVEECISRGASDVLTEQSSIDKHRQMLLDVIRDRPGWTLPLLEQWTVFYGSPQRPNVLLHFGADPIKTDPSGMKGEPMTIRACAGLGLPQGGVLVDPCMGKGMTSRMAHYFGMDAVGLELSPSRLGKTISWLERQGYKVQEALV